MTCRVFVPRLMDESNLNSQNKNAQAILSRWGTTDSKVDTLCYNEPSPDVSRNSAVTVHRLWRGRLWTFDLARQYQRLADVIFYPGGHSADYTGMRLRELLRRRLPIVTTVEGLIGNPAYEKEYSNLAGHPVYCQQVSESGLARWNAIFSKAKRIVAISPFLASIIKHRYDGKVSVLPLGIDLSVFYPAERVSYERIRVVTAGRVELHKRPELFVELARSNPTADFVWFGEGALRQELADHAREHRLSNIAFPGSVSPRDLADQFRRSHLFVMTSKSEGVPKVSQEAAACGLAQVMFGFYQSPTVVDKSNGFVVWDDKEFRECVEQLIQDRELLKCFGERGAVMARQLWNWNTLAPSWERLVFESAGDCGR